MKENECILQKRTISVRNGGKRRRLRKKRREKRGRGGRKKGVETQTDGVFNRYAYGARIALADFLAVRKREFDSSGVSDEVLNKRSPFFTTF